jgi:hypothetical protein
MVINVPGVRPLCIRVQTWLGHDVAATRAGIEARCEGNLVSDAGAVVFEKQVSATGARFLLHGFGKWAVVVFQIF